MFRRCRQRGQALVETALILPVFIALVLGAYDTSIMASDHVQIVTGARHGARIASQLGGRQNNPAPPASHNCEGTLASTVAVATIDRQIVQTVIAATLNTTYATINEIDIYRPNNANGRYVSGDLINRYNGSGTLIGGTTFPLTARCQGPLGFETSIGVMVQWTYRPANGIPGPTVVFSTANNNAPWAVEKMTLCTDNCVP
jgi:hypothetical protein